MMAERQHQPVLSVRDVARAAYAAGLCVVPPAEDGTKMPLTQGGRWKHWQSERPDRAQLQAWYAERRTGVGILTGAISQHTGLFEFDRRATYDVFRDTADAHAVGLGDLVARIEAGYCEATPGGGMHWLYRCPAGVRSTPLARYLSAELDAHGKPKIRPLIETKGEGGYVVLAPSWGRVHPSGQPYVLLSGGVETIAEISAEEQDELYALARAFDELPAPEPLPAGDSARNSGTRPGDDFNARGPNWETILEPHGWTAVYRQGRKIIWRRPGKERGISATTNWHDSDLLYVFSTSTPFAANEGCSKWRAWAILNYGNDDSGFKAAARELGKQGYGASSYPAIQLHRNGASEPPGGDGADAPPEPPALPQIDAGDGMLRRAAAAAWDALEHANEPPFLFRQAARPARVVLSETGVPAIEQLTEHRLRHVMARVADWYVMKKIEDDWQKRDAKPPLDVVRDMLAAPAQPLPPLIGITEAPTFAVDGTLHDQPGYHPSTRNYYAPAAGFVVDPVPVRPTAADLLSARELLLDELLGDFPFVGDAERAHAVALLLLPFVRNLIDGPTPLHLIEKPTPGTGAGLLADVLSLPAIGRSPAIMTEGRDEDEWRKRITSLLRGGAQIALMDNLRRRLDSAALSAAITSTAWTDRLLGVLDNVTLPVRTVWVATGNNPALSSEITRRTIRIRIDAKTDRPHSRTEFRHPHLHTWAEENRAALVWAALTLIRGWFVAGQPAADDAPGLGSFERWSRVMGGILQVAEIPGFLSNLNEFYDESDTEGSDIRAFLAAWWDRYAAGAVGVADLFAIATSADSALDLAAKTEQGQKVRLGALLRELKDRQYQISDDLLVRVMSAGTSNRATRWRLDQPGVTPRQHHLMPTANESRESDESFPTPFMEKVSPLFPKEGGKDSSDSRDSLPNGDTDDLDD